MIISTYNNFYEKNKVLLNNIPEIAIKLENIDDIPTKVISRLDKLIVDIQKSHVDDSVYQSLSEQIYDHITLLPFFKDEFQSGYHLLDDYNAKACKRILDGSNLDLEIKILKLIVNKYKTHRHIVVTTLDLIKDINQTNFIKSILKNIKVNTNDSQFNGFTFNNDFIFNYCL